MATFPTSTDDDGTGTTGTITDQAYMHAVRDYADTRGAVTYSGANFTGSGTITWTVDSGDQSAFRFQENGKIMTVWIDVRTSTVTGTGAELRVGVPNGRTIQHTVRGTYTGQDAGTEFTTVWQAGSGLTYISFYRNASGSNWTGGTNNCAVWAICRFEID